MKQSENVFLAADDQLLLLEHECRREGFSFVAGVDEVGRGPLAGPVVAAAVSFADLTQIPRVFDSKSLSEKARERLATAIYAVPGVRVGLGVVSVELIDKLNILNATHLAMRLAVADLGSPVDFVLIDGNRVRSMPYPNRAIVKGDRKSASIAAASIVAKVYRDHLMTVLDGIYPGYGLAAHKGYGTAEHLAALQKLGASRLHRRSFSPVKMVLEETKVEQLDLF